MKDQPTTLWTLRTNAGRWVECVTRLVPNGIQAEILYELRSAPDGRIEMRASVRAAIVAAMAGVLGLCARGEAAVIGIDDLCEGAPGFYNDLFQSDLAFSNEYAAITGRYVLSQPTGA